MPEFVVFLCSQCGSSYPGVLEATETREVRREGVRYCGECLDTLFGIHEADEGAKSREEGLGTAPDS